MNTATMDGSRALYGISKDGMTIREFGKLNRFRVPALAMTVDAMLNILLISFFNNPIEIIAVSNIGYVFATCAALSGFLLLRKDRPNWPRPVHLSSALGPAGGGAARRELHVPDRSAASSTPAASSASRATATAGTRRAGACWCWCSRCSCTGSATRSRTRRRSSGARRCRRRRRSSRRIRSSRPPERRVERRRRARDGARRGPVAVLGFTAVRVLALADKRPPLDPALMAEQMGVDAVVCLGDLDRAWIEPLAHLRNAAARRARQPRSARPAARGRGRRPARAPDVARRDDVRGLRGLRALRRAAARTTTPRRRRRSSRGSCRRPTSCSPTARRSGSTTTPTIPRTSASRACSTGSSATSRGTSCTATRIPSPAWR